MLVLSRKVGEEIVIGGVVRVMVLRVQGKRVKMGIAAPAKVSVNRPEAKPRDGKAAASPAPTTKIFLTGESL